ncbi:MAG: enoyl-CoA hydratase-related protein [Micropepsaceae bacterium]
MAYEQIAYEVSEKIATITLNRPEKMNAFTGTMMSELIDAFDRANKDDEVRVIIVTGAGKAFCAGADLSQGAKTFDYDNRTDRPEKQGAAGADGRIDWSNPAIRDGGGMVTLKIFESLKPVIGAINGAAVGIGVTMQLPMDIRIASENARFGFVFARRGIVPEACSSYFLPRIVGISTATEWCFTGRVFGAQEAKDRGLVTHLVKPEDLDLHRARAGEGNRRQHRAGVDRPDATDAVADAGRRPSDGRAQDRFERRVRARPSGRRQRRRDVVPGEAPARLSEQSFDRYARILPLVDGADLFLMAVS